MGKGKRNKRVKPESEQEVIYVIDWDDVRLKLKRAAWFITGVILSIFLIGILEFNNVLPRKYSKAETFLGIGIYKGLF